MSQKTSLFIVGCGRNGTSMTAGLFRNAGLFMGDNLHPPSQANPRGYFEDSAINRLNNQILGRYLPQRVFVDGIAYQCDSPGKTKGWLSRIPLETDISATAAEQAEIDTWVTRQPFCLKDTRFCYLLHLWRKNAGNARMICVFRPPEFAAASILKSCRTRPGLADFAISVNQAFEIWTLMYTHILRRHVRSGDWFFVHYADILNGRALDALEQFSGARLDRTFPKKSLDRTEPLLSAPADAVRILDELRERASECCEAGSFP